MSELREAAAILAALAAEAGVLPGEMRSITVIEFAVRLAVARARRDAQSALMAEAVMR